MRGEGGGAETGVGGEGAGEWEEEMEDGRGTETGVERGTGGEMEGGTLGVVVVGARLGE